MINNVVFVDFWSGAGASRVKRAVEPSLNEVLHKQCVKTREMTVLAYLWKIITIKIKVGSWINHAELFEALGDNSLCSKVWMECYPFIFSRIIFSSFSCVSPKAFNVHLIVFITLWLNSMQQHTLLWFKFNENSHQKRWDAHKGIRHRVYLFLWLV